MERVELTDEMRRRILDRVRRAEAAAARRRSRVLRSGLAAAACAALLLAGALALPGLRGTQPGGPPDLAALPGVTEAASAGELSALVGFDVPEVSGLPFSADSVAYFAHSGGLAEIRYSGQGQTAVFRMSAGDGDNSGDYEVYAVEEPFTSGGVTGVLKGAERETLTLAVWYDGAFSRSLRLDGGLPREEWLALIAGVG